MADKKNLKQKKYLLEYIMVIFYIGHEKRRLGKLLLNNKRL